MEMFISFFTGKVMLFYGISLIMKEKSNASALVCSQIRSCLLPDSDASAPRFADKDRARMGGLGLRVGCLKFRKIFARF